MIKRSSIQSQINSYLDANLRPDEIVIGALRYGAHLPHLYVPDQEHAQTRIPLVLSHMLGFFPPDFYKGKRFLLLDDTVYTGNEMGRLVNQLVDDFGVPRTNIRTAALVSHKEANYDLDCPGTILEDDEYIVWKEALAQLVRRDIRPTDRDHPLYYFKTPNCSLGTFLNGISPFGKIHAVGDDWESPVFRFSLNIHSECLGEILDLTGVELSPLTKIRFYWSETATGTHITMVPIIFSRVDVRQFCNSKSAIRLAELVGLRPDFFDSVISSNARDSSGTMAYYFISRAIASLLLRKILGNIAVVLNTTDATLEFVEPAIVDGRVEGIFPPLYEEFYSICSKNLGAVASRETEEVLPLVDQLAGFQGSSVVPESAGLLPARYRLLEVIVKNDHPATWNGQRWLARAVTTGCEIWDLIKRFRNDIFVSVSLDDLFDAGLIRARDAAILGRAGVYGRFIMSGSEYHAVHVSRIIDTLHAGSQLASLTFGEAKVDALWEPI